MAPVPRLRCLILALLLTFLSAPAFAGQRVQTAPESAPAGGIVLRFLHILAPFLEKLGPGMDPLGTPGPQPADAIPGTAPQGDLGPGMDPLG